MLIDTDVSFKKHTDFNFIIASLLMIIMTIIYKPPFAYIISKRHKYISDYLLIKRPIKCNRVGGWDV